MNEPLSLPSVTLLTVTSVNIEDAAAALMRSSSGVRFGAVKLLSPTKPPSLNASIEHSRIPNIDFRGYSKFILEDLHQYVETPFCLVVQADGFVINPTLWRDDFLAYDYIGAPWPERVRLRSEKWLELRKNRVGNGGFSLRSIKLLRLTAQIDFERLKFPVRSEDLVICHFLYEQMVAAGVKFAPLGVAKKFSIETCVEDAECRLENTFGFHGKRWLAKAHSMLGEGSELRRS